MATKPIAGVGRTDLWKVPFTLLRIHPDNPREDLGDIKGLAASIKASRVKVALIGTKGKDDLFYITDGQRRYYALEYLYKQDNIDREVTFQCEPNGTTPKDRLLLAITAGIERKELTVLEQANAVLRLKNEFKMSEAEIAKEMGKTAAYINRLCEFENVDPAFLAVINKGIIAPTAAINMLVKGEVGEFLKDLEDGLYNDVLDKKKDRPKANESELFQVEESEPSTGKGPSLAEVPKSSKQSPITEKVIRQKKEQKSKDAGKAEDLNSYAELKKFVKSYAGKPKTKDGQIILLFVTKLINNKIKPTDFKTMFK